MYALGLVAAGAAVAAVVIGALQAFGVTELDADDMLSTAFILFGAVVLIGALGATWPLRGDRSRL